VAISLLTAVNATLKRVSIIEGSSGELTTFTDSARQTSVDVMIDVWNEVVDTLYSLADSLEGETASSTFTLALNDREYALASDYVRMIGNPINSTNNRILFPYPGGYQQMLVDQLDETQFTGAPLRWVVNPNNGEIRVDSHPTSSEVNDVYTYQYEKALNLSVVGDTFPFGDEIVQSLYPAVAQAWTRERQQQFDQGIFNASLARAAQKLRNTPTPRFYGLVNAAPR
jgi:hypothetical protein